MEKVKDYEKQLSYMTGIPYEEEDILNVETVISRLMAAKLFKAERPVVEDGMIKAVINYLEKDYLLNIYPNNYNIPEGFRLQHFLTEDEVEVIRKGGVCVVVEMMFSDDYLDSYHLQLKVINTIVPELAAVFDESSEKILSGKWVQMAAESNIPPAPSYVYTIQAVSSEEDDSVWLHTHGLNRCGITEFEDLDATRDNYVSHCDVINTLSSRALEEPEILAEKQPLFLARLSEDVFLVVTYVNWEEVINNYPENCLGGKRDRTEDHNENTSIIYAYANKNDCEKEIFSAISIYDEYLVENPLYMFTNKETKRMSALARERINYLERASIDENCTVLVKIALKTDKEFEEYSSYEHIWFEVKSVGNGKITGVLTQDPYYVKGISKGYEGTYNYDNITDWMIFTKDERISPDMAYLLDVISV